MTPTNVRLGALRKELLRRAVAPQHTAIHDQTLELCSIVEAMERRLETLEDAVFGVSGDEE
jgi:hypothetical protein